MPNVAGVQFPYTPQGEQAAQQYQRSLSPGPGLGFRPLGSRTESNPIIAAANQQIAQNMRRPIRMEQGGNAEARIIAKGLTDLMSDGTNEQVQAYINKNRSDLVEIAKIDDRMFDVVRLMLYGDEAVGAGGSQTMEEAAFGAAAGAGAALDVPLAGRNRLGIDDAAFGAIAGAGAALDAPFADWGLNLLGNEDTGGLGRQEALRAAGTQPYLYGPSPPSEQFDDTTALRSAGQYRRPLKRNFLPPATEPQMTEPQIWEFEGMRHGGAVQGMAHGGVPRGTVAGELEPRGYLTARQAGETMRERAKGLRGRRNYGGGIGSLYNRYG